MGPCSSARSNRAARPSTAILAALALLSGVASAAAEVGPQQVIETSNREILDLYAADSGDADSDVSQQVFDVMDGVTSFSSIADVTIDGLCDRGAGDDCEAFKEVFQELLRVSSVRKLGRYRADRFDYLAEEIEGEEATVRTLAHYGDEAIEVDYSLRQSDGEWVIQNYIVDGVDTIKNYRKQFTRMLGNRSVESVTDRLRRRIEELREES